MQLFRSFNRFLRKALRRRPEGNWVSDLEPTNLWYLHHLVGVSTSLEQKYQFLVAFRVTDPEEQVSLLLEALQRNYASFSVLYIYGVTSAKGKKWLIVYGEFDRRNKEKLVDSIRHYVKVERIYRRESSNVPTRFTRD